MSNLNRKTHAMNLENSGNADDLVALYAYTEQAGTKMYASYPAGDIDIGAAIAITDGSLAFTIADTYKAPHAGLDQSANDFVPKIFTMAAGKTLVMLGGLTAGDAQAASVNMAFGFDGAASAHIGFHSNTTYRINDDAGSTSDDYTSNVFTGTPAVGEHVFFAIVVDTLNGTVKTYAKDDTAESVLDVEATASYGAMTFRGSAKLANASFRSDMHGTVFYVKDVAPDNGAMLAALDDFYANWTNDNKVLPKALA